MADCWGSSFDSKDENLKPKNYSRPLVTRWSWVSEPNESWQIFRSLYYKVKTPPPAKLLLSLCDLGSHPPLLQIWIWYPCFLKLKFLFLLFFKTCAIPSRGTGFKSTCWFIPGFHTIVRNHLLRNRCICDRWDRKDFHICDREVYWFIVSIIKQILEAIDRKDRSVAIATIVETILRLKGN